jgi:hypothetical protein
MRLKGNLALADPFENRIAPLPVGEQAEVFVGQVDSEVELALLG